VNVARRVRSFGRLVLALAKSSALRDQLKHIIERPPLAAPPAAVGRDVIDVQTLLDTISVDALSKAADDYFLRNRSADLHAALPLDDTATAAELLIGFSQIVAGLHAPRGSAILDFGAGTCWSTRMLAQMGYAVTAVDVSATALEIGRELLARAPIAAKHVPPAFLVFDGHRLDLPDASVDRVVCLNAFHHVPNPADVLAELSRVLRPGGIAGFSEPGAGHSRSSQAQYEMRTYTVIENDIVIEDIERWALAAGFSQLKLAVFDSRPYLVDWAEYQSLVAGGVATLKYGDFVREAASNRRAFFLYKEGAVVPDSRDRWGLNGVLRVTMAGTRAEPGGVFSGEAEVVNTGANVWLPSDAPFGAVRVGVHLFDRSGTLVELDFARVHLPHGVSPGESLRFGFRVPAPPPGDYRLGFDLVSEGVCWFEVNGARPVLVDVIVDQI
jgi:SAM-dependent methyltransferase